MIQITDPSQCCGCTACVHVCNHRAITMQPDALGFLYPVVDTRKCVDCGLCDKVCSFHAQYDKQLNLAEPQAYAVRHKNIHEVETSRSGAVFSSLVDWTLAQQGVVYGVGYQDHFRAVHKRATTKAACFEFKGSKYVQSDLGDTFSLVKSDLQQGKVVLFSGTPCQTSGLKSYLSIKKIDTTHLYIADIVCHGVPSPSIWKDYLSYIEKKHGQKALDVSFRDKKLLGWAAHKESFRFSDKTVCTGSYTYLFYEHIMFRHSCGVCYFTNTQRPSDITMADFWGWEKTDSLINADDKGVSLVLVNTEKGERLFKHLQSQLHTVKAELCNCLQPNLQHPSVIHPLRNQFEKDYINRGIVYLLKKYGNKGIYYKLRVLRRKCMTAKRLFLQKIGL